MDEAYASLNMGAGFALFVPPAEAQHVVEIAAQQGIKAYLAGRVEAGEKQVVIEPLGIVYEGERFQLRA
jgi:phosphoribosylformylglycinamidine cyclo-ligase